MCSPGAGTVLSYDPKLSPWTDTLGAILLFRVFSAWAGLGEVGQKGFYNSYRKLKAPTK